MNPFLFCVGFLGGGFILMGRICYCLFILNKKFYESNNSDVFSAFRDYFNFQTFTSYYFDFEMFSFLHTHVVLCIDFVFNFIFKTTFNVFGKARLLPKADV